MARVVSTARFAAAALLAVSALALLSGPSGASPTPGFTVVDAVTIERTSLTVEGTITVATGGTLTLDGVDLVLAPSGGAPGALIVERGGTLFARDSVIRAPTSAGSDGIRVELLGFAEIRSVVFVGLAADPTRGARAPLADGFRIAPGGILVRSSDVLLEQVTVRGSAGCGVTVDQASPAMASLDIAEVSYRLSGSEGHAAAVCVEGGSPTIEGLRIGSIGVAAPGSPSALFAAGLLADTPYRLTLEGIDARGFAPALEGRPAPVSVAVLVRDPAFVLISGGRIEGVTNGIVIRGSSAPAGGGSITIESMSIVNIPSGPVSVIAAYSTDPGISWSGLDITGCGGHGLYFESQYSAVSTAVTATVSNVTARNCGAVGINLFDNGAQGAHYFNVWDTNASRNGQQGFYLHGSSMGAGLNVQVANSEAWWNNYAGFLVEATYATTAAAKLASAKFEQNTAENNSNVSSAASGGFILNLGLPTTMSLRYLDNAARGNKGAGGSDDYGHYIGVVVGSSLTIGTGAFSRIVAVDNGDYGFAIVGGTAIFSRFDAGRIRDSVITGHGAGILGYYARIEVWNSTMANTVEFEGTNTGFYILGTVHNRLTGTTTGTFFIRSYKQVCIHGVWQNSAPLYLVPLTFTAGDANAAASMYSDVSVDPPIAAAGRQTDANGNWSGWVLDWTFDPQAPSADQRVDYAPVTISVQFFETSAESPPFDLTTNICGPIVFTDPNPPTLIMGSPRENGTYTKSSLVVSGSVSDDLSGVAGLQVSLDGSNWTDLTGPPGSFSYTFVNLSDGVYDLRIRAWDRANVGLDPRTEAIVTLYSITIDTVAPAIALQEPRLDDGGEYSTSNDQIFFRGTVDASVTQLYINGQPIPITGTAFLYLGDLPNEGPQTFLFLAIDAAGNARNLTVTIYKDKVVPTLIITAPTARGDIYIATHTLDVEGITDSNVVVTVNGVSAPVLNATFRATLTLTEGRNVINVTAIDAAGNRATRSIVVTSDTAAPVVDLTSHHDGMYLNSSRVELVGSTSEAVALLEVNLRIFPTVGLSFNAVLGLAEGQNTLSINATDRAGNVGRRVVRVTVDTIAPEITLFALPDFLVRNTAFLQVAGGVSEEAAVTLNGVGVDVVAMAFDLSLTLVEGTNIFQIQATDLAGNTATEIRRVILDTGEPTILVTEPTPGGTVHSRSAHIVGVSEPFAAVQVGSQLVVADSTGRFSAWVPLERDGANVILITVTDAAGNTHSESYTVSYEAQVVDTGGEVVLGVGVMAALAVGLALASMFIARKRVDGEVEEAVQTRSAAQAAQESTPGYTEPLAPDTYYAPPEPQPYGGAPQAPAPGYDTAAPPPPPPRPPRPPRPPSN